MIDGIDIFGIHIKFYSLLILLAFVISYFIIVSEAKRHNYSKDLIFNMMFWVFIMGIIGARLWYVLFRLDIYLKNPLDIFMVWKGGLAIHGGIIFGGLTMLIFTKKYKLPFIKILDYVVLALILAQAIGRWGNFFNQEAYGSAVDSRSVLEGMKIIPSFVIDRMYILKDGVYAYRVPMFYFESLWCLIGFLVMVIMKHRKYLHVGTLSSFYLIWYSLGRLVIESFRDDSLMLFGTFKVAQIVSVILIIIGIIILMIQSHKGKFNELYSEINTSLIQF